MIAPGCIVKIRDDAPQCALFIPSWENWVGDASRMPSSWYVRGTVNGGTHFLVISAIMDWQGKTTASQRMHLYVWVMGRGHVSGSTFGWLPVDHVSLVPTI